ncbi:hypothetical protein AB6E94_19385 [Vibrio lentus]|uniref:hypothetical protein n=1 Tax=Vibrio splendidus TaxID=29497 RepID=UPI000C82B26F|nr:hypothetical protein [Vibrio splendidus]PMG17865.1 hypothetical protein BCU98_00600 [Vibrio splendidus]
MSQSLEAIQMSDNQNNVQSLPTDLYKDKKRETEESEDLVNVSVSNTSSHVEESPSSEYADTIKQEMPPASSDRMPTVKKALKTIFKITVIASVVAGAGYAVYTYKDALLTYLPSSINTPQPTLVEASQLEEFRLSMRQTILDSQAETLSKTEELLSGKVDKSDHLQLQYNTNQKLLSYQNQVEEYRSEMAFLDAELTSRLDTYKTSIDEIKAFIKDKAATTSNAISPKELSKFEAQLWLDIKRFVDKQTKAGVKNPKQPKVTLPSKSSAKAIAQSQPATNVKAKATSKSTAKSTVAPEANVQVKTNVDGMSLYSVTSVGGDYIAHLANDVVLTFAKTGDYISDNSDFVVKAIKPTRNGTTPTKILLQNQQTNELVILAASR